MLPLFYANQWNENTIKHLKARIVSGFHSVGKSSIAYFCDKLTEWPEPERDVTFLHSSHSSHLHFCSEVNIFVPDSPTRDFLVPPHCTSRGPSRLRRLKFALKFSFCNLKNLISQHSVFKCLITIWLPLWHWMYGGTGTRAEFVWTISY